MQNVVDQPHLDDPLASVGARFAQGRNRFDISNRADIASEPGVRPFGLRFAKPGASATTALPPWRFDAEQQLAVGADGTPWYRGIVDMTMKTTGPSPDGTGNTGGEEWGPDHHDDEPIF